MNERQLLGQAGEGVAADFLRSKGYTILAANWRVGRLELDLVARTHNTLVVVEIKTRSTINGLRPEIAVNGPKQRRLAKAAGAFLSRYSLRRTNSSLPLEVRFDIIAVRKEEKRWMIYHLEDAFFPGL